MCMAYLNSLRPSARQFVSVAALVCVASAFTATTRAGKGKPKLVVLTGTVVAYAGSPHCMNDVSPWRAIILLHSEKGGEARYALASMNVPCGKSPEWPTTPAAEQELRLLRSSNRSEAKEKLMQQAMSAAGGPPTGVGDVAWTCRIGADCSAVPYGKMVPSFEFEGSLPLL